MADRRKLQGEVDRVLKKVAEGAEAFQDIWQKVQNANNTNQKDKYEAELKREIKKLQRLREQIKTWAASSDIKDKKILLENRRLIEQQMEKFRIVEKETKTKAYSKEGLGQASKVDPAILELERCNEWINDAITKLTLQIDTFEAEIESMHQANRKKKLEKDKQDRVDELREHIVKHRHHIAQLEHILRKLDNESLEAEKVNKVREDVEYYIDNCLEPDFAEDEGIYDELELDIEADVLLESIKTGLEKDGELEDDLQSSPGSSVNSGFSLVSGSPASKSLNNSPRKNSKTLNGTTLLPVASSTTVPTTITPSTSASKRNLFGNTTAHVSSGLHPTALTNHVDSLLTTSLNSENAPTVNGNVDHFSDFTPSASMNNFPSSGLLQSNPSLLQQQQQGNLSPLQHQHQQQGNLPPLLQQQQQQQGNLPPLLQQQQGNLPPLLQQQQGNLPPLLQQQQQQQQQQGNLPPPSPSLQLAHSSVLSSSSASFSPAVSLPSPSAAVVATSPSSAISSHVSMATPMQQQDTVIGQQQQQQADSPQTAAQNAAQIVRNHVENMKGFSGFNSTTSSALWKSTDSNSSLTSSMSSSSSVALPLLDSGAVTVTTTTTDAVMAPSTEPTSLGLLSSTLQPQQQWSTTDNTATPQPQSSPLLNNVLLAQNPPPQLPSVSSSVLANTAGVAAFMPIISSMAQKSPEPHLGGTPPPSSLNSTTAAPEFGSGFKQSSLFGGMMNSLGSAAAGLVGGGKVLTAAAATQEVHLQPVHGVAPLGPVLLTSERLFQLKMLEAAYHHLPQKQDSERMRPYFSRSAVPIASYHHHQPPGSIDSLDFFQRLSTETLFFIFYYQEGTRAQYLAAKALKKQSWRFHTKYMMWFQRHEEPKRITDEYEEGTYIFFDYEKWSQRKRDGFTFEYRFLEDKDLP